MDGGREGEGGERRERRGWRVEGGGREGEGGGRRKRRGGWRVEEVKSRGGWRSVNFMGSRIQILYE